MRHALIGLLLMASTLVTAPANAAVNVSIGVNVPVFPQLVQIPNYPVYYAPSLRANYFFYDGLYWVFSNGVWYESPWYNGPWYAVDPYDVPVFLLRVPVRYYHVRPTFFQSSWGYDAPPRWDSYWGSTWSSRHRNWDRWDRRSAPRAAPLPTYQRQYSGNRYPSVSQQAAIQTRSYSYTPRDNVARQRYEARRVEARNAPRHERQTVTQARPERIPGAARRPEGRDNNAVVQRQQQVPQREQAVQAQKQQRAQQQQQAQQQRTQRQQAQQQQRETRQAQRPERVKQAERHEQPQRENRGHGKGHDRNDDRG